MIFTLRLTTKRLRRMLPPALAGLVMGVIAILMLVSTQSAFAHNIGNSHLYLQIYEESVEGRFEIALADLNPALGFSGTELEITPENIDDRVDFLSSGEVIPVSDALALIKGRK